MGCCFPGVIVSGKDWVQRLIFAFVVFVHEAVVNQEDDRVVDCSFSAPFIESRLFNSGDMIFVVVPV